MEIRGNPFVGHHPETIVQAFLDQVRQNATNLPDPFVPNISFGGYVPSVRLCGHIVRLIEEEKAIEVTHDQQRAAVAQKLISGKMYNTTAYDGKVRENRKRAVSERSRLRDGWYIALSIEEKAELDQLCVALMESSIHSWSPSSLPERLQGPMARLALEYGVLVRRFSSERKWMEESLMNRGLGNRTVIESHLQGLASDETGAQSQLIGRFFRGLTSEQASAFDMYCKPASSQIDAAIREAEQQEQAIAANEQKRGQWRIAEYRFQAALDELGLQTLLLINQRLAGTLDVAAIREELVAAVAAVAATAQPLGAWSGSWPETPVGDPDWKLASRVFDLVAGGQVVDALALLRRRPAIATRLSDVASSLYRRIDPLRTAKEGEGSSGQGEQVLLPAYLPEEQPWRATRMIKVLLLSANPIDSPLNIDEEFRAIDQKIRSSEHRDHVVLIKHGAVRLEDIPGLLMRHKPHIVQFSGHGDVTGIVLTGADGTGRLVAPDALANIFRALKDNVRVVLLNACDSALQAEAIVSEIDCAVGMSDKIEDEAAIAFAAAFYEALGYGRSVQTAFDLALVQFTGAGADRSLAKLHKRRGVKPAEIILVTPPRS